MRISTRLGGSTRISMGIGGWLLVWIFLAPFAVLWLAARLLAWLARGVIWLCRQVADSCRSR